MKAFQCLLCLSVILITACAPRTPDAGSASARIRVATDPVNPPFSYLDDQDRLSGFEIELLEAIAARAAWQLDWVRVPKPAVFGRNPDEGILAGLQAGRYDAVVSAITISSDLTNHYAVSQPYLNAGPLAVVDLDSPLLKLGEPADQSIGMLEGSQAAKLLAATVPEARIQLFRSPEAALDDLADKRVDAVVLGLPQAAAVLATNQRLQARLRFLDAPLSQDEQYGLVAKAENTQLINRINQALAELEADGSLQKIKDKWLWSYR